VNNPILQATQMIPAALKAGQQRRILEEIFNFVDVRCFQEAGCSATNLRDQISDRFGVSISETSINNIRSGFKLKYRHGLSPTHSLLG
jgi:hypothetical protein